MADDQHNQGAGSDHARKVALAKRLSRFDVNWRSTLSLCTLLLSLVLLLIFAFLDLENGTIGKWFSVAIIPVLIGLTLVYWFALDELAKEAHKAAWYWGGALGLGFAVGVMPLLVRVYGEEALMATLGFGAAGFEGGMRVGAIITALGALIGYLIAWLIFWVRKL